MCKSQRAISSMASPDKSLGAREQRTVNVNFVCQRCCQPLKLESSFGYLEEQTIAELTAPLFTHFDNDSRHSTLPKNKVHENEDYEVSRKEILPLRLTDSGNGFMLVGDTDSGSMDFIAQQLRIPSRLFDIMSDQSDIDHPLCEECTDYLLDQMDQQLKIAEDEQKAYKEFLDNLETENKDEDLEKLQEELDKLKAEEARLEEDLCTSEEQEKNLKQAIKEYEIECDNLQREEQLYWHQCSSLTHALLKYEDEQRSVDNQLRYAQAQLDRLTKTNVFNATFHIWHSGHFGTINNFRLGRLPSVPVDWTEINAAWGQTVLLLYSLAKKMNLTFERYRLIPYGNHSFLESLEDKSKELPLYGSGGFKFFWDTKFDQAMVAFLDCLQQFKEEVEKGDTGFCLPYRMEKGKIEDTNTGITYSIKIQFNSEEQWTKALKFMLTNLKWGLAWVSSQFANR